jgi:hypothetical protein
MAKTAAERPRERWKKLKKSRVYDQYKQKVTAQKQLLRKKKLKTETVQEKISQLVLTIHLEIQELLEKLYHMLKKIFLTVRENMQQSFKDLLFSIYLNYLVTLNGHIVILLMIPQKKLLLRFMLIMIVYQVKLQDCEIFSF